MDVTSTGAALNYSLNNMSQNISETVRLQGTSTASTGSSSNSTSQVNTTQSTSASSSASDSSKIYDPKDLNKDGVVTYAEELQYLLTHPAEKQQTLSTSTVLQTYNSQGQTEATNVSTQSSINTYA